jgi:endonuclease YncB( thermonuclease family)
MHSLFGKNKIFLAIIIGAVIIGGCVYTGLKKSEVFVAPKAPTAPSAQNPSQNVKTDLVISVATCGASDNTIVTKVIDGDTVVVEGGYHVRLLGMDADEKGYPCYDPAKIRLENLILSKQIRLEKDKTDLDQYDRCLRYVFIDNANIDVQLVKEGLAVARFYEPDVKYRTEITDAEIYAQHNKVGCKWAK